MNASMESFLDRAEQALSNRDSNRALSEASFLWHILRELNQDGIASALSPTALFRMARSGWATEDDSMPLFSIVGLPSLRPRTPPLAGDWILRVVPGIGDMGHVSLLACADLLPRSALEADGIAAEGDQPGYYGIVIESGAFPHSRDQPFARRILDGRGKLPPHTVVLRPNITEEEQGVIGRDNRVRVQDTTQVPGRWICKIRIDDFGSGREVGSGTGLLISNRHVLTAAHVIYDAYKDMQKFVITVTPALNDLDEPFDHYTITKKPQIRDEYSPSDGGINDFDYALLTLEKSLGQRQFKALQGNALCYWGSASCGINTVIARIDPHLLNGRAAYTAGYPSGKGRKQLWSAAGLLHSVDEKKRLMWTTADTTVGQSGSPVWVTDQQRYCLVGIAAGAGTSANAVVRVTRELIRQLQAWISADDETVTMTETVEPYAAPLPLVGVGTREGASPFARTPGHESEALSDFEDFAERFDPANIPANVAAALSARDWPRACQLAIASGWHDENDLTDLLFFARHPELASRVLDPKDPKFKLQSAEWSTVLKSEVRPAIEQASENTALVVSGRYVAERDPQFRGAAGQTFRDLVAWAAREVDLNPGFLGAVLLAEWDDNSLYLGSAPVRSFQSGSDDFFESRGQLAANVPAFSQVHFDVAGKTTNTNEHGREVTTIPFLSGKDATLATAVYLKYAEIKLRKAAKKNGGDFDTFSPEVRFALVRIAMAAGHGGIDTDGTLIRFKKTKDGWAPVAKGESGGILIGVASRLARVLAGDDILIRKNEPRADPSQSGHVTERNATILAAQALHLSDWIFDQPPTEATKNTGETFGIEDMANTRPETSFALLQEAVEDASLVCGSDLSSFGLSQREKDLKANRQPRAQLIGGVPHCKGEIRLNPNDTHGDTQDLLLWNFDVDGSYTKRQHETALDRMILEMHRRLVSASGAPAKASAYKIFLSGFASRTGSREHNQRLAAAREDTVQAYLLANIEKYRTAPEPNIGSLISFEKNPGGFAPSAKANVESAEARAARVIAVPSGSPVPAPLPWPPSTMEAQLRELLTASMLLAGDASAEFHSRALPQGRQSGSLWSYDLELTDRLSAINIDCLIEHGAHLHPARVLDRASWDKVKLVLEPSMGRQAIELPFNSNFLLGSFATTKGSIVPLTHAFWRLEAEADAATAVIFGFDVTHPGDPQPITDPSVFADSAANATPNRLWMLACCELVLNRGKADFEPSHMLIAARIYPMIEVLANFATAETFGQVTLRRPATSSMDHGWADGGRHAPVFYTDRNEDMGLVQAAAGFLGKPGAVLPAWDNLFDYFDKTAAAGAARTFIAVDPTKSDTRNLPGHRLVIDRDAPVLSRRPTNVMKVPRQGAYDNVHIAPAMLASLLPLIPSTRVVMAPVCAHDCFHMHWRWSKAFDDVSVKGWGIEGPYTVSGAPMIQLNQTLQITTTAGVPGIRYEARAKDQPAKQWMLVMPHGGAYALKVLVRPQDILRVLLLQLGPLGDKILNVIGSKVDDELFALFYFLIQYWPVPAGVLPLYSAEDVLTFTQRAELEHL
jgi:V8-like Glu-specific endopeptidase